MPETSAPPATTTATPPPTIVTDPAPPQQSSEFVPWKGFADEKGSFAPNWWEKLSEDPTERETLKSLERYKSLPEMAKGLKELEKTLGQKAGAVKIPTDKSSPEEVAAYRKAMGVPDTIEAYDFKPDGLPDSIPWSPELAKPYAEVAHKHNIPPAAMKELAQLQVAQQEATQKMVFEEHQAKMEKGISEMRQEYGADYDKVISRVKAVAAMGGLDATKHQAFADPDVVRAFIKIGEKFSDDQFEKGGHSLTKSSAEIAKEIQTDKDSPLYKKYREGDPETIALLRHHLSKVHPD